MTRTTLALCLLLALAVCGAGWGWQEATRYERLYAETALALEDQKALTKRIQKQVQKADKDAATARQRLKEALDAVPEWRDSRTPEPVRDSLCSTLRCVKPSPVPAPSG